MMPFHFDGYSTYFGFHTSVSVVSCPDYFPAGAKNAVWGRDYRFCTSVSRGVRHGASRRTRFRNPLDFTWISDFRLDSCISRGFLDFWISQWISGFQIGFLPTVYEISFVADPSRFPHFSVFHLPYVFSCTSCRQGEKAHQEYTRYRCGLGGWNALETHGTLFFFCEIRAERPTITHCKLFILKLHFWRTIEVYNTAWSTAQGAFETILCRLIQNTVILTVIVFQGSTAKGKSDIWLTRARQYTDGRTYWKSKSSYIEYSSSNSANESGLLHLSLSTIVRKSTTTGKKQPWMVSDTLQVHKIKFKSKKLDPILDKIAGHVCWQPM